MNLTEPKTHNAAWKPLYKSAVVKKGKLRQEIPVASKGESWWMKGAAPELPRSVFTDAAKSNNIARRYDPKWQRPSKAS